jgi:HK97 gp10 family phage protein
MVTTVDATQVENFAKRLALASRLIEEEGEDFTDEWGGKWADEMKATVPVDTGKLRDSIRQVEPGGITMGDAFYWPFVDRGTARMAPQPFVQPAMKRIRKPAAEDAGRRAVRLISRG